MKKILILLFGCFALTQTASAQSYYESDSDIYGLGSTSLSPYANQKPITNEVDLYIQDGWGIGYQLRREFGKYVGWNILGASYMSHFGTPEDFGVVNVKVLGVRGYTPAFHSIRGYADLNLGYSFMYNNHHESHNFSIDFSVGVQLSKHIAIGYNLNSLVNDEAKYHWARFAFLF
ncbi:MAG: hypothetical protein J5913_00595 [Prevotella sp.]|nr:hypothetical protein [Prevotella sp.]MBP3712345.1 hypothetical protein [Bacteroidaceae bacterium]